MANKNKWGHTIRSNVHTTKKKKEKIRIHLLSNSFYFKNLPNSSNLSSQIAWYDFR